jgi:hypothetical protein
MVTGFYRRIPRLLESTMGGLTWTYLLIGEVIVLLALHDRAMMAQLQPLARQARWWMPCSSHPCDHRVATSRHSIGAGSGGRIERLLPLREVAWKCGRVAPS